MASRVSRKTPDGSAAAAEVATKATDGVRAATADAAGAAAVGGVDSSRY
jgi:hypothetical protein